MSGCRKTILAGLAILAPILVGAQETPSLALTEPDPETVAAGADVLVDRNGVDELQSDISDTILNVVHRFDSFFGEDLIDDDQDGTLVRLQMTAKVAENDESSFNNRLSVRLRLPRLHNRIQVIFDDVVEKNEEKDIIQEVKDSEPLTGLRYVLTSKRARFNLDVGVKLRSDPDAFVRGRVSKVFPMDPWSLKLSQDVYWFVRDGPGELTQVRLSRRLNHLFLFRATTRAKWDESHDGITFSQAFALYHEISKRQAVRYTLRAAMPTSPSTVLDEYGALVTWRRLVRGDWCYIEIEPQASFPRDRDYRFTPSVLFKLELMFGDTPDGFWQ